MLITIHMFIYLF